jgi:signal transduction histidine kinase/CheY-like chemotaxis protein
LTLRFKESEIEKKYKLTNKLVIRKYNIVLSIISFLMTAIPMALLLTSEAASKSLSLDLYKILCYIVLGINLFIIVMAISIRSFVVQRWLAYLNFYLIMYTNMIQRYYLSDVLNADYTIFSLIFSFQHLYRLIWYFTGLLDFIDGMITHIVIVVSCYVVFGLQTDLYYHYRFTAYSLMYLLTCIISYYYIKEKRKSFYYNYTLSRKVLWYEDIFNNMTCGFLSVTDQMSIKFVNKTMASYIMSNVNTSNTLKSPTTDTFNNMITDQNDLVILKEFFSEILISMQTRGSENLNALLRYIKLQARGENSSFIHLGNKTINLGQIEGQAQIYLEVYGRFYGEDNYEFIFKDVSKIKIIEEANLEFKFKSLYLSKIAHEFKNPLLCIGELIDNLIDKPDHNKHRPELFQDSLNKIKAMSEYLLILIKDIDHFSQKQNEKEHKMDLALVSLDKIINFCQDITKALVSRYEKCSVIVFNTILTGAVPKQIYTDEMKLKQILINLLSNAVKYTSRGSIVFEITSLDDILKFTISDTGKGICEENISKLFTPFDKHNYAGNSLSTGLGLSIVKDLLEELGSNIEYTTEPNKGSTFSFTIPKTVSANNNNEEIVDNNRRQRVTPEQSAKSVNNSSTTIIKDYYPIINNNIIQNSYFFISTDNNKHNNIEAFISAKNSSNKIEVISNEDNLNILLVDDEILTRGSTIRLLKKFFKARDIDITIYEASDGIECLSYFHKHFNGEINLNLILSDETMRCLSGLKCAKIIRDLESQYSMRHVPFVILSAYDKLMYDSGIDKVYSKPITTKNIEELLNYIK